MKYTMEQLTEAIEHLAGAHEVMKDKDLMAAVKEKMKGMSKIKSINDIRVAASESQKESLETEASEDESKETHMKNTAKPK